MFVVDLGFACNNACVFCAQGALRARPAEAPRDEDEDMAHRFAALRAGSTVALVGGEPTLDERLPDWIRAAEARGAAQIVVQTNGRRLAYRGYAAALRAASKRLRLEVSVHGSTAPMHDYHTATPGSFGQTVKGLKHAQLEGIEFSATTVVTRSNFRHLVEITRLVGTLGARALQFSPAVPLGNAARVADRVIAAPELVSPHLARAMREAVAMGLQWRVGARDSGPDVAGWFAGLGQAEEETADGEPRRAKAEVERSEGRVSLPMLGRPAPARAEVRTRERRTGTELRGILPGLFNDEQPREKGAG
ncbi:radical SAM protein [Chondromyces crocatus]|uniref:Radical SAM core domain-containing protein n=1 Tax=Chondromyces crocatus TaxID=52 RepID=A0A0K1E5R3_CHOCO|nr:radical SAM protein [Chondromyces crocatus]AKT36179.1 uncharacterized protein CMC5_002930 [Chondromyces crocatus]